VRASHDPIAGERGHLFPGDRRAQFDQALNHLVSPFLARMPDMCALSRQLGFVSNR
jgi:hypothetical protein